MNYKFCEQLQKSVFFGFDSLLHCCNCDLDRSPCFYFYYSGKRVNWKKVIAQKEKLQERAKTGKIPFNACRNCCLYKESDEWQDGCFINEITISQWTKCLCNCYYCYTAIDKERYNAVKPYSIINMLKDMEQDGVLRYDGIVRFVGGDISQLEDFNEVIDFLLEKGTKKIFIPTSGITYMPAVEKVLKAGVGEVVISLDSGNKDLYKKIKRIDAFDNVVENCKKYSDAAKNTKSIFELKYILLPFVNDKKELIDEWINLCLKIGVKNIADDYEGYFAMQYPKSIPAQHPELLEYIHKKAHENNLEICRFRYAYQLMYEIQQGTKKIATSTRNEKHQRKFVEKMLERWTSNTERK
jgi:organic radical activating enzyme